MAKTILVLGGGVGGLVTAVTLRKKLPASHRIILVDQARDHLFQPSLLWVLTGDRQAERIVRPLDSLGRGNFYGEPLPQVAMKTPGRRWHLAKVLFEKQWLWRWF